LAAVAAASASAFTPLMFSESLRVPCAANWALRVISWVIENIDVFVERKVPTVELDLTCRVNDPLTARSFQKGVFRCQCSSVR
jgi:hypothetical protein